LGSAEVQRASLPATLLSSRSSSPLGGMGMRCTSRGRSGARHRPSQATRICRRRPGARTSLPARPGALSPLAAAMVPPPGIQRLGGLLGCCGLAGVCPHCGSCPPQTQARSRRRCCRRGRWRELSWWPSAEVAMVVLPFEEWPGRSRPRPHAGRGASSRCPRPPSLRRCRWDRKCLAAPPLWQPTPCLHSLWLWGRSSTSTSTRQSLFQFRTPRPRDRRHLAACGRP